MSSASLTRRVRFSAAHRYRLPDWDDRRNEEVFGSCALPNYHGHNYTIDVTVTGDVDSTTGMVIDLRDLDAALRREVTDRFDHKNINLEVPEFGDGRLVPTGENLARFIFDRMSAALGSGIRVSQVRVAEDESLSATVTAP